MVYASSMTDSYNETDELSRLYARIELKSEPIKPRKPIKWESDPFGGPTALQLLRKHDFAITKFRVDCVVVNLCGIEMRQFESFRKAVKWALDLSVNMERQAKYPNKR